VIYCILSRITILQSWVNFLFSTWGCQSTLLFFLNLYASYWIFMFKLFIFGKLWCRAADDWCPQILHHRGSRILHFNLYCPEYLHSGSRYTTMCSAPTDYTETSKYYSASVTTLMIQLTTPPKRLNTTPKRLNTTLPWATHP
jgi:hypothetical protein